MNDLYLMFMNMTRKGLRLALTLFAIFIAFMIYGVLSAFNSALNAGVDLAAADRLVAVNKVNFTQPLPYSYFRRIQAIEDVSAAAHLNWFGGYYQDPQNFMPMFAASPAELLDVYDEILISEEERGNFLSNRQGLLVGRSTAEKFGWSLGDRIPISSNIFSNKAGGQSWDFDVVAIYDGPTAQADTVSVYFHYEYFNESRTFGKDNLGFIAIRTVDPDVNDKVIKAVDDMFANSPFETETVPEEVFSASFVAQIGDIGLIISSVVGAAFFTSLFVVGNTMVIAIRERTSEIGVMKALGFPSGRIFRMVLGESVLQALVGGLLGIAASFGLMNVLNTILGSRVPELILRPELFVESVGLMLLLGLLTGAIPAMNALKLNVIAAFQRR